MKDSFEKFRKTPEKPKETAPSHPYRDSISEQEQKAIAEREKADNALRLKKIILVIDGKQFDPSAETIFEIEALGARIFGEELPAGSPKEATLSQWLTELTPPQKMDLLRYNSKKRNFPEAL